MRQEHKAVDLRHLRAFAAIVDSGGFARAAIRLNLSQPALSRQIAALESNLGVPLFDRLGRRALLTSEGEDLLRRSRRLLSDADSLGERARALKGGHTGLLRVGSTPQAMETLLAGFLARYRRRHPGVEVQLIEDGGARLPARLEHGDVHLALVAAGDARFRWRLLGPVYLLAVLPTSHPARLQLARMVRRGLPDGSHPGPSAPGERRTADPPGARSGRIRHRDRSVQLAHTARRAAGHAHRPAG
jgi:DNA-binding transcriptional LysR family regulator